MIIIMIIDYDYQKLFKVIIIRAVSWVQLLAQALTIDDSPDHHDDDDCGDDYSDCDDYEDQDDHDYCDD